jgi:hypothetical protein
MFAFTLLVQKRVSEAQKRVDNARLFDSDGRESFLWPLPGNPLELVLSSVCSVAKRSPHQCHPKAPSTSCECKVTDFISNTLITENSSFWGAAWGPVHIFLITMPECQIRGMGTGNACE